MSVVHLTLQYPDAESLDLLLALARRMGMTPVVEEDATTYLLSNEANAAILEERMRQAASRPELLTSLSIDELRSLANA
jgi:hypothetical protein